MREVNARSTLAIVIIIIGIGLAKFIDSQYLLSLIASVNFTQLLPLRARCGKIVSLKINGIILHRRGLHAFPSTASTYCHELTIIMNHAIFTVDAPIKRFAATNNRLSMVAGRRANCPASSRRAVISTIVVKFHRVKARAN